MGATMNALAFPGGAWPVMLTPFCYNNKVDYDALKALTTWYINNGCSGLFANCQSSEMFFLSLDERINIAKTVIETAAHTKCSPLSVLTSNAHVPVIVSGHIADSIEEQIIELNEIAKTKPAALIFITNRFAKEDESDELWRSNCQKVMEALPDDLPLGMYECPYPYKRLISIENLKWCANTGRFHFLKDTCCDLTTIVSRIEAVKGTNLKIYNANTTTLLDSLQAGAHGFSGVMASFQMSEYAYLCKHALDQDEKSIAINHKLQDLLTTTSLIERQYYPVNAKYYLKTFEHLPLGTYTRVKDHSLLVPTLKEDVAALKRLSDMVVASLGIK